MRIIFILLLLLKTNLSDAQKSPTLQGKWKVISVSVVMSASRDSLHYDFENDSIHIPAEDFKEASKDGLDSVATVDLFKGMYGSFKESTFTFEKDSVMYQSDSTIVKGPYRIKDKDTIIMRLKYEKEEEDMIYTYSFRDYLLVIVMKIDIGYYKFILKRE